MNLEKLRSPARATFKSLKISLRIRQNLEIQPKTNTQKIPNLNLWVDWENLYHDSNFTVEKVV